MPNFIVNFAHWLENTGYALYVAGSLWIYPFVQMTHFTGLSLWVGTNIAGDLKLMGIGKKGTTSIADYWDSLIIWNWVGFAIAFIGGFTMFSVAAVGYVRNPAFLVKLGIIVPLGLIVHIMIQLKARQWSQLPELPSAAKWAGFAEMLLWVLAAVAAVSIPEFG